MSSRRKSPQYDYLMKLLVIGDSGVGKSSLLLRFAEGTFTSSFITTIGIDFKIRIIEIDGKRIKLQIWDTAGQERFRTITTAYYRGAMGIILMYDISEEATFGNVRNWMKNIKEHAAADVNKILIGNKADLVNDRAVDKERGQQLANEYEIEFLETSAKTDFQVEEAFIRIATKIKKRLEEAENQNQSNTEQHNQSNISASQLNSGNNVDNSSSGNKGCKCA
mmetsp:Transcript_12209/g.18195  ORF Transcript_12209/g.18195 Transcript_12209/m.18195 type:complete len:222 (+) Transcript_12209:64-729(+)